MKKLRRIGFLRILRDCGGASAVEFALTLPILVGMLVPTADLGFGFYAQMRVQNAAQAGAEYAILHGWNNGANVPAIEAAVASATSLATINASPAPTQACGCANGTSIAPAACTATCPDGASPGSYVTVNAVAPYSPFLPYPLIGSSISLTAVSTVRVQ
ncbi:MAG TPA: TadE/TadG family type IV pilus assembly protein [Stellaceae bacterium]|nr:TadE/TadG family type IV pilus assembly protein [Stellaceae bacterium]